ncbi:TBC1 domain family member 13-like isoform X1 [Tigriopus californicus]|uniref:TBC1 domain family member 13-like isoform X1 n=1 Tax=Tigriopus californicus TaxID=6832 RepID=UPI0027DA6DA5|nr:TBC1 domain family member 13-like isoform X1 [Tigriopus californicus]
MSDAYKQRVQEFDDLLNSTCVDREKLKKFAFEGIPEGAGRRSLSWRILLNYLPEERSTWNGVLTQQRKLYQQFLDEMILVSHSEKIVEDHPLNPNPESHWQSFFKDNEVLLQIDKDVRRLCPDISFFSQGSTHPNVSVVKGRAERLHQRVQQTRLNAQTIERKGLGMSKLSLSKKLAPESYAPLEDGEAHWEIVERILFLYAKLNPGQSYVQGMNEIIGPIYYVFASDSNVEWREYAEADCFFCFTNLMSDIRDFFIKTLDEAETGINGLMIRFMNQVKIQDPKVHQRLTDQDIKPQFFAFRWLTLMLSQEFDLPDVLRIWDSLLCDETRRDFLLAVCTAMVVLVRDDLLHNDFPENMKLLQNYPFTDVQIILSKAASLMA